MTSKCIKLSRLTFCLLAASGVMAGCTRGLPPETAADISAPREALYAPAQIVDVSTNGAVVTLEGLAPSDSQVIVVSTRDRQVVAQAKADNENGDDVNWEAEVNLPPLEQQTSVESFGLITLLPDEVETISPERITILRKRPQTGAGPYQQAVIVSRPGAASIIMADPLEPLITPQGLALYSIDYDDNGSVIFSGRAALRGRIRIYVNGEAIGETGLGEGGSWFVIAGWTLPVGTYPIEIHRIGLAPKLPAFQSTVLGGALSNTTLPESPPVTLDRMAIVFNRDDPKDKLQSSAPNFVTSPYMWEYRYDIPGGGRQYTAVYGAQAQRFGQAIQENEGSETAPQLEEREIADDKIEGN